MKSLFFKSPHLFIPATICLFLIGIEFPIWVSGLNLIFLLWRFLGETHRIALPPRWLTNVMAALVLILVFFSYGTLFDKEASPLFFSILCGLKILESRDRRDHFFIAILLLFLLANKFLFTIDLWILPVMLWLLYHLLLSLSPQNLESLIPHKKYLFPLLKAILVATPITIFLYFSFPRFNSFIFSSALAKNIGISGFGTELRPGSIAKLALSKELIFRAEFLNGRYLETRDLYWRGLTLKKNDGFKWTWGPAMEDQSGPISDSNTISYKLTVEPSDQRWTFPLDHPINLASGSFSILKNRDGAFQASKAIQGRAILRGESTLLATDYKPKLIEPYLQLNPISQELRNLVDKLKGNLKSRDQIVKRITEHFRDNSFYYTLNPGNMDFKNPDDFIFKIKKGFCEHYASAFAILSRAAGVPARVVVGFHGGDYNKFGNFYAITAQDAHAWNEFLNDQGTWQRIDVVDVVAPLRTELGATEFLKLPENVRGFNLREKNITSSFFEDAYDFIGLSISSLNFYWTQWLLDFNLETQNELLHSLRLPLIAILFIFISSLFLIFLLLRLKKLSLDKTMQVTALYGALISWARQNGLEKKPTEGPLDLLQRLQKRWPEHRPLFAEFLHLYINFAYASQSPNFDKIVTMVRILIKLRLARKQKVPVSAL